MTVRRTGHRAAHDLQDAAARRRLELFLTSLLNGVTYGLLLFMLSSGLTLIFSMMGVLNFAHASFYMLGAYFGYVVSTIGRASIRRSIAGPARWWAPIGALVERYGLRRAHASGHVSELLFTFGLAFVIEEVVHLIWGKTAGALSRPRLARRPALHALLVDVSRPTRAS